MWLKKQIESLVSRISHSGQSTTVSATPDQNEGAGETAGAQANTQQSDATAPVPAEVAPVSAGNENAMTTSTVASDAIKVKNAFESALNHLHKALQWAGNTLIPAIEKSAPDVEAITELVDPKLETFEALAYGALGAVSSQLEKLDSTDAALASAAKENLLNIGYDETAIAAAKAAYATIKGDISTLKSKL